MRPTGFITISLLMLAMVSCRDTAMPTLRDSLWMWGHGAGTTNDLYNIPTGNNIDMGDALEYMGIPNIFVVRWEGKPEHPFDGFIKQFDDTRRVSWSIVDGAPESYEQKKQWAFDLLPAMSNLTGFCLDDFFNENYKRPVEDIRELRVQMDSVKQGLTLSMVLYSFELGLDITEHIECVDEVLFWTWHATDLVKLNENFSRYRELVPDKRTLLGIYMWDFGNSQPIPEELMKLQLDFALEKYREGEIEGMIFHCTPLVDLGLEAVEYAREWIAKYGDMTREQIKTLE